MFHWVKGIPFEFNAGAYDNLNMWEQMDNGDQYTPAKKFLTFVPIVLYSRFSDLYADVSRFLLSTHYSHYDVWMFTVNCWALMMVLIPKLPSVRPLKLFLYSSTECEFSASTNSISHNLPSTMINIDSS